jgi:monothiol glutaredoxin
LLLPRRSRKEPAPNIGRLSHPQQGTAAIKTIERVYDYAYHVIILNTGRSKNCQQLCFLLGCGGISGYIYRQHGRCGVWYQNQADSYRPQHEAGAKGLTMSIEQFIENEVKSNDVVLFMKGTPQFPMCGFSAQVVQILDHVGVPYKGLNVLDSDELRNGVKVFSNWPTIPQLYVKGEFVGGCDIVREMFQANELQQLFTDKGIAVRQAAE